MSATPRGEAFRESERDRENEVLKRRWTAAKRARLVSVEAKEDGSPADEFAGLVEGMVREARWMRDECGARVIGVIANRVLTARRVYAALAETEGAEAILLTGRSRPYDRDRIWREYKDRIGLGRKSDPERTLFVVATQCIEVGANLEFDALVSEIASIDALEQRFGRLDRDGRFAAERGTTHAAIVATKAQTGKKYEDAIYGGAMAGTWAWLKEGVTKEERTVVLPAEGKKKPKTKKVREEYFEMGVLALRAKLAACADREALITPGGSLATLMPAHMDLLCQTSPDLAVSPEASVFLHGPEAGPADVQVVWRADVERADLEGEAERVLDVVAMCPPSAAEALALPVWAVRRWLAEESAADLADVEGTEPEGAKRTARVRPVLRWQGEESRVIAQSDEVRPGITIVAPADYGGCDRWGWNPASKLAVQDVGDAVKLAMVKPTLRLNQRVAAQWAYEGLAKALRESEEKPDLRVVLEKVASPAGWVGDVVDKLLSARRLQWVDDSRGGWAAVVGAGSFDQSDWRSSYGSEVGLADHLEGCRAMAAGFARDLPERVRKTVVRAAELHDIGKADPRFQAWLRGGIAVKGNEPIAKSKRSAQNRAAVERAREMAGYPKGGRHELMSVALLKEHGEEFGDLDFDLLLHLVGSHHGRCRPFAPVVEDGDAVEAEYNGWRAASNHGLERTGSGIAERFWRLTARYGWWGLAYLETIVRLADHRESEAEESGKGAAHA